MILKGKITMQHQSIAKLADSLSNSLLKIVMDETNLPGFYDFDLQYRSDNPAILLDELKARYGLTVESVQRTIKILQVHPSQSL